ncbi:protein S40-6-like [Lycium ferocissimum]|uniref:protein S40-6-like n=1 Tax=Lycium ferocissimum TaxID=112874 RepID=UPI002816686E|nr:protein S40-6-like [Lycium ferocissimum]
MSSSYEGRYNLYSQGSSGWTSMRNEEFQEEDIWGNVTNESREFGSNFSRSKESSSNFSPRKLPTASKMISRSNKSSIHEPKITQCSAPVNIPDWSKIYGTSLKKTSWRDDENDDGSGGGGYNEEEDDDGDDDEGEIMPPHEWIAKKLGRSKISSFSVCEGVGRTLKGRDLSRVRNAILSKTGFLE